MINNYTLGINFLHSDTSASIFKNNELIAAAEEERFTRIKHTSNFPERSIKFCLTEANINLSQLNVVSINSNPFNSLGRKIIFTLKNPKAINLAISSLSNIKEKVSLNKLLQAIDDKNVFNGKIKFVDHHESHITSSLAFSEFDESVNVSLDGFGDFSSCAWGVYTNGRSTISERIYFPHSLGIFYQAITQFLGFKNYGDEYKVMGLSSYGEEKFKDEISKLVFSTKKGYELNLKYFTHHKKNIIKKNNNGQIEYENLYSNKLIEILGKERKKNDPITDTHKDIAKSAQIVYEEIFLKLLNNLYDKYKIKNLTLSGGCIMNSVANGKILKNTPFKNIYIPPNPGDAGGAIGSAASLINSQNKIIVKNYSFLGNKFYSEDIEKYLKINSALKKFQIKKLSLNDLINVTAKSLTESKIIGWFQGRMEWGPRALGNRSILADPRNPNIKNIINLKIKRRESFRPFAPSVLNEFSKEWFEINKEVPFMSEVYPVKKDKQHILPAITHVDGTGRLQTVKKQDNEKYYKLILRFYELTNVPVILNTSFNENEPIVRSPQEAINCFLRTSMDILVLEDWIIIRE
tara:strand:- start:10393 stop:12123 length:1731 start_codon:yes stop_codon:yes gene_type:complete